MPPLITFPSFHRPVFQPRVQESFAVKSQGAPIHLLNAMTGHPVSGPAGSDLRLDFHRPRVLWRFHFSQAVYRLLRFCTDQSPGGGVAEHVPGGQVDALLDLRALGLLGQACGIPQISDAHAYGI